MSSRHTRRKAAKAKQLAKAVTLATAERSMRLAAIVKDNKGAPSERNFYPPSINSVSGMKVASNSFFYHEPRASGGMGKRGVQALRAKGATFGAADMLVPDTASLDGQRLSGRRIREASLNALELATAKARKKRLGD